MLRASADILFLRKVAKQHSRLTNGDRALAERSKTLGLRHPKCWRHSAKGSAKGFFTISAPFLGQGLALCSSIRLVDPAILTREAAGVLGVIASWLSQVGRSLSVAQTTLTSCKGTSRLVAIVSSA